MLRWMMERVGDITKWWILQREGGDNLETGFFVDDDDDNGNCWTVLEGVYESRGRGCNNYWKIAR